MAEQNTYQIADWNGQSGERWVANQARLDAMVSRCSVWPICSWRAGRCWRFTPEVRPDEAPRGKKRGETPTDGIASGEKCQKVEEFFH